MSADPAVPVAEDIDQDPRPAGAGGRGGPVTRRRLLHRAGLAVAAVPAVVAVVLAAAGPAIAPHPAGRRVGLPYEAPTRAVPLGTDHLGRDVLSGVLSGARNIVVLPVLVVVLGTAVAVPLGLLAGWRRTALTAALVRASELLLVIPPLLVVLVVLGAARSWPAVVTVVAALGVPSSVRYVRAATARAAASGYVDHAVAMGERPAAVLRRELLPVVLGPVLADAGLRLVGAVYLLASASFLGLVSIGGQDWAGMVAANHDAGGLNVWALLAPGLAITAFAVSVNLLADAAAGGRRGRR